MKPFQRFPGLCSLPHERNGSPCLFTQDVMQLLKGSSSHWINQSSLLPGKFGWGRGYGAFSVSQSGVGEVAKYIATQEEHHRKTSFSEELKLFVERYEFQWHDD